MRTKKNRAGVLGTPSAESKAKTHEPRYARSADETKAYAKACVAAAARFKEPRLSFVIAQLGGLICFNSFALGEEAKAETFIVNELIGNSRRFVTLGLRDTLLWNVAYSDRHSQH